MGNTECVLWGGCCYPSWRFTTLVCRKILLETSTPKHPHTSKKHGNRQAYGGGQIFHTGSLTEIVRGKQVMILHARRP